MILHSIEVSGWRCFPGKVVVGPFAEGLNVVYAPNATGKTTLFRALQHGLLDSYSVRGEEAECLRPRGRTLTPCVAIEFSEGGNSYRLEKRFLDKASAQLMRKEGGRFVPLHEGDAADDFVRSLLAGTAPGRGMVRQVNWGLAQVLWAPQGALPLEGLSGDLVGRIRQSLGVQAGGDGADPIEALIQGAYEAYFTPSTGKPRTGKDASVIVRVEEELSVLRERLEKARQDHRAFETASDKVSNLKAGSQRLKVVAEELDGKIVQTREKGTQYAGVETEFRVKKAEAETASETHRRLKAELDEILRLQGEITDMEAALNKADAGLPELQRKVDEADRILREATEAVSTVRARREGIGHLQEEAEQAQTLARLSGNLGTLRRTLERVGKAEETLQRAKADRIKITAPETQELRTIRKASKVLGEARAHLDAGSVRLEIIPDEDRAGTVTAGEEPGKRKLPGGRPFETKGCPEVIIKVQGFGRIAARGGEASVPELTDRHDKAKTEFERLLRPFHVSDMDALERLVEEGQRLDEKVNEAQTKLESLSEEEGAEGLREALARAEAEIETILKTQPAWRKTPPDPSVLTLQAKREDKAFVSAIDETEDARDKAISGRDVYLNRLTGSKASLSALGQSVRDARGRLSRMTTDGRTMPERAKALESAALESGKAEAAMKALASALQSFGEDPRKGLVILERQLQAAGEAERKAMTDSKIAEGQLLGLMERGTYTELAVCEERCRDLEETRAREVARAEALRLLKNTLDTCRAEAVAAVVGPVQTLASSNFQRIAGGGFGVSLGATFGPTGLRSETATLELEETSGGEQEQVHLSTRLALAEVLSGGARQLVVLDDILTATDSGRIARALNLLQELSERLQVVVLTCHPERYRGVPAEYMDLEEIVQRHRV